MSNKQAADLSIFENYHDGKNVEWRTLPRKVVDLLDGCARRCLHVLTAQPRQYSQFVLLRGMETVETVFLMLLLYTGNEGLTLHHAERASLLYAEFMEQIGQDANHFLGLSSRDAAMFVYKKTLYDIEPQIRKNWKCLDAAVDEQLDRLKAVSSLYRKLVTHVILSDKRPDTQTYLSTMEGVGLHRAVDTITTLCRGRPWEPTRRRLVILHAVVDQWARSSTHIQTHSFLTVVGNVAKKLANGKIRMLVDDSSSMIESEAAVEAVVLRHGDDVLNETRLLKLMKV